MKLAMFEKVTCSWIQNGEGRPVQALYILKRGTKVCKVINFSGGQRECFTEACKTKWSRMGLCRLGGRYAVMDEFLEGAPPR